MASPVTCGQGLAEHSVLPSKVGELIAALAENLEAHIPTLDLTDENARAERSAYDKLAERHRTIAAQLQVVADEMASYRGLPMAKHDQRALSSPEVLEAFEGFVAAEQELLALLRSGAARDQDLLVRIREGDRSDDA
jgi:hypothetical protein